MENITFKYQRKTEKNGLIIQSGNIIYYYGKKIGWYKRLYKTTKYLNDYLIECKIDKKSIKFVLVIGEQILYCLNKKELFNTMYNCELIDSLSAKIEYFKKVYKNIK